MRRPIVFVVMLFLAQFARGAGDWALLKVGGRDHVTLDNVAQFYGLGGVQRASNDFTMRAGGRSLRGAAGSVEFYINNLKFNLSYPIVEHDGHLCVSRMDLTKVIEPVLRPSRIRNADLIDTVILDAGHGAHDKGADSTYGYEKDFSLDVVNRARLLLLAAGYKVNLTRSTDVFIPLEERVRFANKFDNAIFVSVHFNSGGAGTGLETYTLAPRGVPSMMADGPRISDLENCPGNAHDAENMALATAMHASLVVRSKMYDRGIKRARVVVIRDLTIPGVLIEGGFLSNAYDAKLIATPAYRQQMASCIVQAIGNYRRAIAPAAQGEVHARLRDMPRIDTTAEITSVRPNEPKVITSGN
jgi:N-acetylmuramoyl-L-alanine amidase